MAEVEKQPTNLIFEQEKTLKELQAHEGKRGLIIIADDSFSKILEVEEALKKHAEESSTNYVIRSFRDGISAFIFYGRFKLLDPQTEKVIMILDGNLGPSGRGFDTGVGIAEEIVKISKSKNWDLPFFIGESSDQLTDDMLKAAFPEIYLGDFRRGGMDQTLQSLNEKL